MHRKVPLLLALTVALGVHGQTILPQPWRQTQVQAQAPVILGPQTRIVAPGAAASWGERLRSYLRPATGLALAQVGKTGADTITLTLDPKATALGSEGYRLNVAADRIEIIAHGPSGLLYGIESLRQLLPREIFREAKVEGVRWQVAGVRIEDQPRFSWRGSHLDVSRHFLSMAFLKKHLELMALHKLNVFHWHLTDDQGWRLEIRKYPRLTSVGAWRRATVIPECNQDDGQTLLRTDGVPHGGFYTQDDVRELVRFAGDRGITVVPEIEMPGHSSAALAAYPELGNEPGRAVQVVENFGVFPHTFAVSDRTLGFINDVLDEVVELFPSKYVHIGGDECPKQQWARSPEALARMKSLGLVAADATLEQLQSYRNAKGELADHPALLKLQSWFIRQAGQHLASKGRSLIGWEEIMQGGLPPGAVIMSWLSEAPGIQAASEGHDVVMTPTAFTYFDRYQSKGPEPYTIGGLLTLAQIYAYEPVPASLTPEQGRHILGAQAQLWSEYVPTPSQAEYMLWPRLAALAEVLWSPKAGRSLEAFLPRLNQDLARLDILDVHYRPLAGPLGWPKP